MKMIWPYVRTVLHHDVVDSTNSLAARLLRDAVHELPLLVRADAQTAGRGRGSNRWWSDRGSLTFTLGIDPRMHGIRADQEPCLALATAVAIIEAIEPCLPHATIGIRWPNDIEAAGAKLGGILTERIAVPNGNRVLVGIGLNVATRLDQAPDEIRRMATSLEELRGEPTSLDDVLRAVLAKIEPIFGALAAEEGWLVARWRTLDTLSGRRVCVDQGSRSVVGVACGIDERGALQVEAPGGCVSLYGGRVIRG
jgi:BirA family biotin operon repressor/biotin-[acetyl-CoA-carboxylase] ligase